MEDISNVSSEEELLQLRNEGKISEAEYQDLFAAMKKNARVDAEPPAPEIDKAKQKRKLGKTAFGTMLAGIILPVVIFGLVYALVPPPAPNAQLGWGHLFLLGIVLEIAAFVMGVIAWPDVFGKATVVSISLILVLLVLFLG